MLWENEKDNVRSTLIDQGIDIDKDVIKVSPDVCNQVIMREGHHYQGYSIRDLLTIWCQETGREFQETYRSSSL